MKKYLFAAFLLITAVSQAQIINGRKVPLDRNNKKNLFDAVPGYRTTAVAFVPFTAGPDAIKKGYKADSTYRWVDPAGKRHVATGAQILQQVNEVEKSLTERGHSFRHKNTFDGLVAKVPNNVLLNGIPNLPANFYPAKSKKPIKVKFNDKFKNLNIAGNVYPYFGNIVNKGEFSGTITDNYFLSRLANDASMISFPLVFAANPTVIAKLGSCNIELYTNPELTGSPVFNIPFDIKKPALSVPFDNRNSINSENPIPTANTNTLYQYNIQFKNTNNIIKTPTRENDFYYVGYSFKDVSGKAIAVSILNENILNNSLGNRLNFVSKSSDNIAKFNFSVTDPVSHTFGLYANSNGFNSNYSNEPFGNYGENVKSSISANLSLGATYYNFWHLLDNNAPKTENFEIIGFDFSSAESYYQPDRVLQIKVPGPKTPKNILNNPNTKVQFRVLGEVQAGNKKPFPEKILFKERFFIGPVPCSATVKLTGEAGLTTSGTYTEKSCDINANVTPYAKVDVVGEGGADAYIAYVLLDIRVNVLTVSLPIDFNITNKKTNSDAALKVQGLSGKVILKAGFCIPIPFFDDICKEFPIEIFSWGGLEETFTIQ